MKALEENYLYYDSKMAVSPYDLQELYRFTRWGRSRSIEQIEKMLEGTTMLFRQARDEAGGLLPCSDGFCLQSFLWDIMVHPDHRGKGLDLRCWITPSIIQR